MFRTKSRRVVIPCLVFLAILLVLLGYIRESIGIGRWDLDGTDVKEQEELGSYEPWAWEMKEKEEGDDRGDGEVDTSSTGSVGQESTRHLVVARVKADDVAWLEDPALEGIVKVVYTADDAGAVLGVPVNKGHEVMIYLTYIIDHYDVLPDVAVFMHAHRFAWHNNDLLNNDGMEMVRRLSGERVLREGYVNLRCQWRPGCPDWIRPAAAMRGEGRSRDRYEEEMVGWVWGQVFPGHEVPEVLAQPCCSQFAVSRETIRKVKLEKFRELRGWVVQTELNDSVSGRMWEYLWQVLFVGEAVFCPDQHVCHCDGYGLCFEDDDEFDKWFDVRDRKRDVEREMRRLRGEGVLDSRTEREMEDAVAVLNKELDERRLRALRRGTDPRVRAAIAGRQWNPGDGF